MNFFRSLFSKGESTGCEPLPAIIWAAARRDILLGLPWIPLYALSELSIAFLITGLVQLIFTETPRVAVSSLAPGQLRHFLQFGQTLDRKDLAFALPILLVMFGLLKLVSSFCSTYFIERAGHRVAHSLRHRMLAAFLLARGNVLDEKDPDRIANQLLMDSTLLQSAISKGLIGSFRDALVIFGVLISIFTLAFQTTIIALAVLVPFVLLLRKISGILSYYARESAKRQVTIATRILQSKRGLLTILGLRTQPRELADLNGLTDSYFSFIVRSLFVRTFFRPGTELLAVTLLAGALLWRFRLGSDFHAATWSAFFVLVALVFRPLKNIAGVLSQWADVSAVYQRLEGQWQEFCSSATSFVRELPSPRVAEVALATRALDYTTSSGQKILNGCNLEIKRGSRVALIGESGSGKTTFLRVCAGLLDPSAGERWIDSSFLLATQTPYVFKGTVQENIEYIHQAPDDARLSSRVRDLVFALSLAYSQAGCSLLLQKRVGFLGDGLSGGEKARVALGRILVAEPKVLLLDEPTANLDADSAKHFWEAVARWQAKDKDHTVVAVLHTIDNLESWDECHVFSEGQIVKSGLPCDLWPLSEEEKT